MPMRISGAMSKTLLRKEKRAARVMVRRWGEA